MALDDAPGAGDGQRESEELPHEGDHHRLPADGAADLELGHPDWVGGDPVGHLHEHLPVELVGDVGRVGVEPDHVDHPVEPRRRPGAPPTSIAVAGSPSVVEMRADRAPAETDPSEATRTRS
jgi:hypothetical protein